MMDMMGKPPFFFYFLRVGWTVADAGIHNAGSGVPVAGFSPFTRIIVAYSRYFR